MSKTVTAVEAHKEVQEFANKADNRMRVIASIKVGQAIRQGDIYVKAIKPVSATELKNSYAPFTDNQLAPGTTQGSRHMVSGDVKLFKKKDADQFTGPVIVSEKAFRIQHPEHAHFELPPGSYQVTYQQDFATQQHVRD